MEISFKNSKIQKIFKQSSRLRRSYGARGEKVIRTRMAVLRGLPNLSLVPTNYPERRHQLKGGRKEQFAVNLVQPYRLIFEVDHEPVPRKNDGGIDLERVTAIKIIEICDYH